MYLVVAIGNDISRARDRQKAENSRVQGITLLKWEDTLWTLNILTQHEHSRT